MDNRESVDIIEKEHPFYNKVFINNWLNFFNETQKSFFKSVTPIPFSKNKTFGYYFNIGKNITNGQLYNINENEDDYKKSVFLIYDVLSDRHQQYRTKNKGFVVKKVSQYQGFMSFLGDYDNFDEYFNNQFSSKSRYNIRKNYRILESNFNVSFKVFKGAIDKSEYDFIFEKLIELIKKRFYSLGKDNNIVNLRDYYYSLCYELILENKASFNVLYVDEDPIAISMSFLSDKELFFAITTFDIDYRRYNLGHILIFNMMKWCYQNDILIFDYSKGEYDYKKRWSNKSYSFENHIIYDSKSFKSRLIGGYLYNYFVFKQFLRDKKVNTLYSKAKFMFKKEEMKLTNLSFKRLNNFSLSSENYEKIERGSTKKIIKLKNIKGAVNDVLYSNPVGIDNIDLFKSKVSEVYLLKIEEKYFSINLSI
ncbi:MULTISPECIES: GNAT family N-acetyltransferase [unclassified Cellulophaga]|uniref:GNAT family N-acetyltransferase n=1 Tax=unclassified Cellulophaga TaxID=2634405 RepID=UPI0026E2D04F|nr:MULTISPECIES: GNAT family N-acetyltransferase [unclassified Cellulophaga]MDO6491483.1 GNAT family N-acetyltransferase [Cellulophaga sp. 2_MG-2023]MDO6493360.1 GNAT family N-acetyltransferase [Cellulophaga sp. 3_MG-2023]